MNRLSKSIFLLALGAMAVSCIVDNPHGIPQGEAIVKLNIKTPAPTIPATRATYGIDSDIVDVWVLVLKQAPDGSYNYQYKAQGQALSQGSATTATFTAVLRQSDNPVKLMVMANCPDDFADGIVAGTPEDDLREALMCGFGDLAEKMPMAGDVELTSLSEGQNSANVALLRSVGRVQVTVDAEVTNFAMTEVYVYRPGSQVQIAATSDNIDTSGDAPTVTAASVPAGSTPYDTPMKKTVTGSMAGTDYFYVPESAPASGSVELINTTNCIVVGGYYNGNTTQMAYYRIDFNSGVAGHPLGQVLRNHGYKFVIKGVSVDGDRLPGTAATELAGSLNVEIVAWDDSATDVYIPATNDYISTSGRTLTLPYEKGTSEVLTVTSTMPFTMSFSGEEGELSSEDADTAAVSLNGTLFSYVLVRTKYDDTVSPKASTYTLTVTAKEDNDLETNADAISIAVGGGTLGVSVAQNTQPTYVAPRTLTVLTLASSSFGGLGTTATAPGGGSMDMLRKMLDNTNGIGYFGPSGDVKLDQISYQESASTNFDNDNDAATFAQALKDVDVIIMPGYSLGNNLPTAANCLKIIDWLADPSHILIISIDQDDSNTTMRNALSNNLLPYSFTSMGWITDGTTAPLVSALQDASTPFSISNTAFGTAPLTSKAGDEIFLGDDAPFGAANPTGAFKTADGIWEYSTGELPIYVYPIVNVALYGTPSGGTQGYYHTSAMLAAVDTRYGIVWMGEPQMWGSSYGGMNDAGTDPLSILTANLWAWIIDRANR